MSQDTPAKKRRLRSRPDSVPATSEGAVRTVKKQARAGARQTGAAAPATTGSGLIRVPLSVRWRDLDAFNHVNNSKFLSYLEEARLRWMVALPGEWIDENVAPVVAAAHVNYRRPIAWPNEIVIELFVERLGNTSLTIGHRIVDATDAGVLYADGNVVMVWIGKQDGQPAALPDTVRVACAATQQVSATRGA
jgi:acyl-CoA thioester hydrolase